MTGKELVFKTFQHEKVPCVPWVPFAGIHAGKLKGYDATQVLVDENKLVESLQEVHRLYMPDGMPICFDLQLEAEILGCELLWAKDNPPSVASHPLTGAQEIPTQFIEITSGRIPLVMNATKRMKKLVGDAVAIYGLFCGPFTLASHLGGTQVFMDMKKNPQRIKELMEYCTQNALRMAEFYAQSGADILAQVDHLLSQISEKHFIEFLHEPYTRIFNKIRELKLFSSFFVCGNALRNIDAMCKTKPDGISIDENIPMDKAKQITDQYNITIGGNIPLTTTMLFGNQQDNMKFVVDMVDSVNPLNLIVSPGCDMPYDIPIENTIAVAETVRDMDKYRELVENYESVGQDIEIILPDYTALKKPLLECCTLDSASCAACTYMWAVTRDAKEKFGDAIDVVEYKYTRREDIARFKKMGVENLPSLYINGELAYASIIPSHEEFYAEIEKQL